MAETTGIYGGGAIPSRVVATDDIHTSDLQGVFLGKKLRLGSGRETHSPAEFELHEETSPHGEASSGGKKASLRSDTRLVEKNVQVAVQRRLPDLRQPAFNRFLMVLRRTRQSRNFDALKDEMAALFPEVSHRHAVLVEVSELLDEKGGDTELAELFQQWTEELMDEQGGAIRASYNISETLLRELGGDTEALQSGRDFYRKAVFAFETPGDSYQFILEESPSSVTGRASGAIAEETREEAAALSTQLEDSLKFLRSCLDVDLKSITPSQDPTFLKSVIDGLYQVEFLGHAHQSALHLLEKFHDEYNSGVRIQPYRLMREILGSMSQNYLAPDHFLNLAWDIRVPPLETTIHFLTQLHEMVRDIPLKIYPQPEAREIVLQAIQLSLDTVIEEEQKELGETSA